MQKIVILSSKPKSDEYLLELVQTLFPDCEICVASGTSETLAHCQADSFLGMETTHTMGRKA
jgi:hypothetical protein